MLFLSLTNGMTSTSLGAPFNGRMNLIFSEGSPFRVFVSSSVSASYDLHVRNAARPRELLRDLPHHLFAVAHVQVADLEGLVVVELASLADATNRGSALCLSFLL